MRLLVLEDDAELVRLIGCSLERSGFVVDLAHTVSFGCSAIGAFHYHLLVLDRRVPDGDGLQLLRFVRDRGLSTPVLFMTAQGSIDERVACLNDGADDYMVKPVDALELLARIRVLLRRQRLGASITVAL